jgi:hypothetical protein
LLHHLGEVCERNITALVTIQELKDMIQFRVIQTPTVQVEKAGLKLLPGDRSGFQGVILVENLRNGGFVPRRHEWHFCDFVSDGEFDSFL